MQHYKQLTSEQRYQISGLRKAGWTQTDTADAVGVNKSTISCELKRGLGQRSWRPKQAQKLRDERRQACTNARQFSLHDWAEVKKLIQQGMSPDQAAERLALEDSLQISHETIYQYIYADKRQGGDLWRHLHCQKPRRKRLCKRAWHQPSAPAAQGLSILAQGRGGDTATTRCGAQT